VKKLPPRAEALSRELAANLSVDREAVGANDVGESPKTAEPTASKTDRFLGCQWWLGKEITDNEVGEPARFGSAFHAGMEAEGRGKRGRTLNVAIKQASKQFDVPYDAVKERVERAIPVLKRWLAGENPWQIDFRKWELSYEDAFAYNIVERTARRCSPPTPDGHVYEDRQPGEIPGTVDLFGYSQNAVLVLDHKSGFDIGSPMESGQLLTLALAACTAFGIDRAFIGYLHAPKELAPTLYSDDISKTQLDEHANALAEAQARRGDGSLRPGSYCKWCQTFSICPKNEGALLELRGSRQLTTAESVGRAHEKLQAARKRFMELEKVLDDEIRKWIRENGDAVRSDGREVGFVERPYTNLSQESIRRALGPIKGGKLIDRLRKMGVIESGIRLELRVK
jgi:PD-(D/E)XK nuclease superfamily